MPGGNKFVMRKTATQLMSNEELSLWEIEECRDGQKLDALFDRNSSSAKALEKISDHPYTHEGTLRKVMTHSEALLRVIKDPPTIKTLEIAKETARSRIRSSPPEGGSGMLRSDQIKRV